MDSSKKKSFSKKYWDFESHAMTFPKSFVFLQPQHILHKGMIMNHMLQVKSCSQFSCNILRSKFVSN